MKAKRAYSVWHVRNLPAAAVSLLFVLLLYPILPTIVLNLDEGLYLQHAQFIRDGQTPLIHFFHHQPPLYIYALSLWQSIAGDTLANARLLSLFAVASTGFLIHLLVHHRVRQLKIGLLAQGLFLGSAPILEILTAMPNALALVFATAALTSATLRLGNRKSMLFEAILLGISFTLKPLGSGYLILWLWLRGQTCPRQWMQAGGLLWMVAALFLAAVELQTQGNFTSIVMAQTLRLKEHSGFSGIAATTAMGDLFGEASRTGWNLKIFVQTLSYAGPSVISDAPSIVPTLSVWGGLTLLLAILAVAHSIRLRNQRSMWAWDLPIWTAFFVQTFLLLVTSDPLWSHYVAFALPLFVAAICSNLRVASFTVAQSTFLIGCAGASIILGLTQFHRVNTDAHFYDELSQMQAKTESSASIFSFNPYIPYSISRLPACGFVDPMNTWDEMGKILVAAPAFSRFATNSGNLQDCIIQDPNITVVVDKYFALFVARKPQWVLWVRALPPDRIITLDKTGQQWLETGRIATK